MNYPSTIAKEAPMKFAYILAVPTGLGLGCAVLLLVAAYLGIGVDTTEGIA